MRCTSEHSHKIWCTTANKREVNPTSLQRHSRSSLRIIEYRQTPISSTSASQAAERNRKRQAKKSASENGICDEHGAYGAHNIEQAHLLTQAEDGVRHGWQQRRFLAGTTHQEFRGREGQTHVQGDVRAPKRKPALHVPRVAERVHHQGGAFLVVVCRAAAHPENGRAHS